MWGSTTHPHPLFKGKAMRVTEKRTVNLAILEARLEQLQSDAFEARGYVKLGMAFKGLPTQYWEGYADAMQREAQSVERIVNLVKRAKMK